MSTVFHLESTLYATVCSSHPIHTAPPKNCVTAPPMSVSKVSSGVNSMLTSVQFHRDCLAVICWHIQIALVANFRGERTLTGMTERNFISIIINKSALDHDGHRPTQSTNCSTVGENKIFYSYSFHSTISTIQRGANRPCGSLKTPKKSLCVMTTIKMCGFQSNNTILNYSRLGLPRRKCAFCQYSTYDTETWRMHERSHGKYECIACDKRFVTASSLRSHGVRKHREHESIGGLNYGLFFDDCPEQIVSWYVLCWHYMCYKSLHYISGPNLWFECTQQCAQHATTWRKAATKNPHT